ncbi:T9SS type A sorting domain-containing protein [Sabulilitoribacter multivorans]|uniref:T9SS type A sorting domain-containing protein n=1 Tax=Flaviramulus multivorans TaxID=1304750 RepID=A0ABS9IIU6_9FLAO|nr:chondroitinase-B domain-containing protein [Flaviramulus multivorans]MCF7560496.1 T9SS type A sorting domain-containing protein [Flaviramulus multivorans]
MKKITQSQHPKSKKLQTAFLTLIVFICGFSVTAQTTYNINNPEELEDQAYVAGDIIILADGTYNSDSTIDFIGNGTANDPITFRAETPGGVKFTGGLQLNIGGDYVVVDGFYWQGGYGSSSVIEFRNGTDYANHSTIQNCVMDGLIVHPDDVVAGTSEKHNWIMLYGTYNTVINCSFMNKSTSGNMVLVELAYNFSNDPCAIVGHTISNNYFYKYDKIDDNLTNAGDSETIRIGTSSYQQVDSSCTVSNNYFVEADGENEIITNKSKNNIYTNNTFRRSRGSLVLRHGSNATVDGNYFLGENVDGTGGIRIVDSDHTITNNYIQDCITVVDQAKWNNGITFLGGGANNSVLCSATNVSSDYQKVENISVSNNTIINTNAPLYYNIDKGSTDPTGTVSNNLIYFAPSNPNISDVISGDTPTSYANLGTALTYSGNVYTGTSLGATNAGFSEETGITATPDGEIFTFSGTGSAGKGADMGAYTPTTDDMVGYGIGACFLDYLGNSITDGDCTIVVGDFLTVSSLPALPAAASSNNVTVNSNVSWTAVSNDAWISIDISSGTGNATVSVTVTENTDTNSRTGSVTFTQDAGGDDIVRTLNVMQDGADLTDLYDLINTGLPGDPVTIHSFSKEEANGVDKFNYASNTLDKDTGTNWTADDGAILSGDYKGDGEYVIYDLGEEYELDLIQIATDDKADPYGLQVLVSTTGTDPSDFSLVLPTTGDLLITTTTGTRDAFDQYEITTNARYVKLMGYGRFNTAGDTRKSVWTNITEIEFFGQSSALSVDENDLRNKVIMYPVPVKDILTFKNLQGDVKSIQIYTLEGRKVLEQFIDNSVTETTVNLAALSNGAYLVNINNGNLSQQSKMILVSH